MADRRSWPTDAGRAASGSRSRSSRSSATGPPALAKRPASFGRERRIRRRAEFVHVQTVGERATSPHFVLLVAARLEDAAPSRLGIVVTRKVGNAVARNRIKRVCRECFRAWPGFVPDGIDLVVIARAGAHELPLGSVRDEWARARPTLLKRCASVLRKRAG